MTFRTLPPAVSMVLLVRVCVPASCTNAVKLAAVIRSWNLSPVRYALAVVPSCPRTAVMVSVERDVTLTISMLFETSVSVA